MSGLHQPIITLQSDSQHPPDRRRGEVGTRLLPPQHYLQRPLLIYYLGFWPGRVLYLYHLTYNINILVQPPRPWPKSLASYLSRRPRLQATLKFVFTTKAKCYWLVPGKCVLLGCRHTPVPAGEMNEQQSSMQRETGPNGSPSVPPQKSTAHVGHPSQRAVGDLAACTGFVSPPFSRYQLSCYELQSCLYLCVFRQ